MKLATKKAKQGDIIYMVGYPSFIDFEKTLLRVIKATVTGENEFFGRKLFNTSVAPAHGCRARCSGRRSTQTSRSC